MPSASGSSGPTTVRPMFSFLAKRISRSKSFASIGTLTPSSPVPALPGAQKTSSTRGDCASFHTRACSRPPLPMTRTRRCRLLEEPFRVLYGATLRARPAPVSFERPSRSSCFSHRVLKPVLYAAACGADARSSRFMTRARLCNDKLDCALPALRHDRHRPVVHQLHLHHRPESPGRDTDAERCRRVNESFVQRHRDLRAGGVDEAGPAPLAAIAVERELADD